MFLLAGAFGHFGSVWPAAGDGSVMSSIPPFSLLFPGLLLALTGLVNICLCKALWAGANWALQLALAVNLVAVVYLGYLLNQNIPGHPIGIFVALVSSQVLLLAAIRLGLTWPARERSPDSP